MHSLSLPHGTRGRGTKCVWGEATSWETGPGKEQGRSRGEPASSRAILGRARGRERRSPEVDLAGRDGHTDHDDLHMTRSQDTEPSGLWAKRS